MRLINLTQEEITQFAGKTIFNRGYDYYLNDQVFELEYDDTTDRILAEVYGNYGDYEVDITSEDEEIAADCTCPYDGYPCKHIVAVLLQLIHHKEMYLQQAAQHHHDLASLIDNIRALSKNELVEIVVSCLNKYPDFERDLMVRFAPEDELTLSKILTQVETAFPSIELRHYSTHAIARQLTTILKSASDASAAVQVQVAWAVADRTLEELNAYGMNDGSLENVAIDAMEKLGELLPDNPKLQDKKQAIIEGLMDYYTRGNCGLVDAIYDAAHALCSDQSDYQIVIRKLEAHLQKSSFRSYYQSLLSRLYGEIGDTNSQLRILQSHLEYGMDYWRLAQYWIENGEQAKALQVVQQGIDHGQGRKTELYDFMQAQLQVRRDVDGIFDLLLRKIKHNDLDHHLNLIHDHTYQYLADYYAAHHDHDGQVKLLELCLTSGQVNLDFYKTAEKTLTPTDWPKFEKRIIAHLKKAIQKTAAPSPWLRRVSQECQTLAAIYAYKNDLEPLCEIARTDMALLAKYESKLLPHYPELYLDLYKRQIDRLIAGRGRENYQTAAEYAKTVKKIYQTFLNTPNDWNRYIDDLRRNNKRLRALQEEFIAL